MPLPGDLELHFVNSIDEVVKMRNWLGERRDVLGLDTETSGLNPYAPGAELRTIQIGDHTAGWTVPVHGWGGAVIELLNQYDGPIAVHNLSFDAKWLENHTDYKIPWERTHDTMIMHQMLYPGDSAALKVVTDRHIDPRASMGQERLAEAMRNNGWGWDTIPIDWPDYVLYAALDPVITAYLWSHLRADQKYPEAFDMEMSVLRIATQMEDRGITIDVDYCIQKQKELDEYVDNAKKWALDTLGISISSPPQLAKYIEQDLNTPITKRTPGGAPSTDKETMAILSVSDNPKVAQLAQFVTQVRDADKLRSSYFENFIKENTNGILHPQIKTMQARTGRMSITNPALQTLPSGGAIVRNAVLPREEDHSIYSADLDQVEFRIFASLAKDLALTETFRHADETGGNAFVEIGKQVFKEPDFHKGDYRYKLTKSSIYGRLFGASVKKQAQTSGVPVEDMQEVNDSLNESYPGLNSFQRTLINQVEAIEQQHGRGYVTTQVTGRRLPVDEGKAYTGVNYKIQGTAAEILKKNLIRLDAAGLGEYLVVPVHDEVIVSAPTEDRVEVLQTMKDCMTTTEGWLVPLTAGSEGPYNRWGEAYA